MSNTVDEIHTPGRLAGKAEIFHSGSSNVSSFPNSLFIPLRAPLLAPNALRIRTTLCKRDRYDFLLSLLHCLLNSVAFNEIKRCWNTTVTTWNDVHSLTAGMINFIWELYKISACKHLLSQPDRRFNYIVKVMIQPNIIKCMTFLIIFHREWCNSVKLRECMSDSLSLCMFRSAGAKRRATVPLFKAVCLSSSHHPPPHLCLSVYHPGPKVASLRSVLLVRYSQRGKSPERQMCMRPTWWSGLQRWKCILPLTGCKLN